MDNSDHWQDLWNIRKGTTYLNHGSFGPSPLPVVDERIRWLKEFESQPMDMLTRQLGPLLDEVCESLGKFLGGNPDNFVLVPNSTTAMNIVAQNIELQPGDEVLLNDHEYGAVIRIWGQKCKETGARTVLARLPQPLSTSEELADSLFSRVTERTRLIVVSHVTSATATIFPVQQICRRARERGIPICIDGPHAIAMIPFRLDELDCDYYTASCHKWLSAPLGSGFLYVRPRHKQELKPAIWSWGRSLAGGPPSWKDEFHWSGTFDPSAFLAIPAAIRFLEDIGLDRFRAYAHALATLGREKIERVTCEAAGQTGQKAEQGRQRDNVEIDLGSLPSEFGNLQSAICPSSAAANAPSAPAWFGSMITIPLPQVARDTAWPGKPHPLQDWLWERHGIEVPIMEWHERVHIRVSCHLYNTEQQIDTLAAALEEWLNLRKSGKKTGG